MFRSLYLHSHVSFSIIIKAFVLTIFKMKYTTTTTTTTPEPVKLALKMVFSFYLGTELGQLKQEKGSESEPYPLQTVSRKLNKLSRGEICVAN